MRKWLRTILIPFLGCAFVAAGLYAIYLKEPSFEGKRLSEWVWTMDKEAPGPEKEKARGVVRHLGANSIPLLVRWLREPDSPSFKEQIFDLKSKFVGWLVMRHVVKPNSISVTLTGIQLNHRTTAGIVLAELDSASKKAVIPQIIQMLGDKNHRPDQISAVAGSAYVVLPKLAPESINPLIVALSSKVIQVWALAGGALGNIGPAAKQAIPILEKRLNDKDPLMRVSAADIIGKLGGDPDKFIPVVIRSLPEVKWDNLDYPLGILEHYKEHAKAAVPFLLSALKNTPESTNTTNMIVRGELMSALQQIDPGAATKAGAQ